MDERVTGASGRMSEFLLWLSVQINWIANWMADNRDTVSYILSTWVGCLLALTVFLVVKYRRRIYSRLRHYRKRFLRLIRPKGNPAMLAKWQKGLVADKIGDVLLDLNVDDKLTPAQYRHIMKGIGLVLNINDLIPRRSYTKEAIRLRLEKLSKNKLSGPKNPEAANKAMGGPPQVTSPVKTPVVSDFLAAMRKKAAQAA